MYLHLDHKRFQVYKLSVQLLKECYKVTELFPPTERYNLFQQMRRAALSVMLNIAEGASRRSQLERRRFYEVARGSVIEIDSALEAAINLNYATPCNTDPAGSLVILIFRMLSGMIKALAEASNKE